jgi:hypothetical protein
VARNVNENRYHLAPSVPPRGVEVRGQVQKVKALAPPAGAQWKGVGEKKEDGSTNGGPGDESAVSAPL